MTDTPDLRDQIAHSIVERHMPERLDPAWIEEKSRHRPLPELCDTSCMVTYQFDSDGISIRPLTLGEVADAVAPLLAVKDRELERWRTGLRRLVWPRPPHVPNGTELAAALARASHDQADEQHGDLMRSAAAALRDLDKAACWHAGRERALSGLLRGMARKLAGQRSRTRLAMQWDSEHQNEVGVVRRERDEARARVAALGTRFEVEAAHAREVRTRERAARARVAELEAREQAVMAALKGVLPEPSVTDADLCKVGDVVFAVVRMVERLRADLAEALEVAERAARDTGQRTPLERVIAEELADFGREEDLNDETAPAAAARVMRAIRPTAAPSSGLGGHATPDTTPCGRTDAHPPHTWPRPTNWAGLDPADLRCPGRKTRRDERINPAGLYTEPTDPAGA